MKLKIRLTSLVRLLIFLAFIMFHLFRIESSTLLEIMYGMLFWFILELIDSPKEFDWYCIILLKIWKFIKEVVNAFLRIPRA